MKKMMTLLEIMDKFNFHTDLNLCIEFPAGLSPMEKKVQFFGDLSDKNFKWRILDLSEEMPIDFNDLTPNKSLKKEIEKTVDESKNLFKDYDEDYCKNLRNWIFIEWEEVNRYGKKTNIRRLVGILKY
jgi:superfamily I DNA and/or RNA helicase